MSFPCKPFFSFSTEKHKKDKKRIKSSTVMKDLQLEDVAIKLSCPQQEKEPKSPQIDLTLPNCADYAALGYKVGSM